MCEKPHVRWVSVAIKSRHAGLNRLQCAALPFLWCISDRPQLRAQNPEGLCTTQRQPAQGRPDRCALTTPRPVYIWAGVAIEFVIPLCNAMTGKHENGLLRNFVVCDCAVVFVNLLNVALLGRVNGILLQLLWLWDMGMVRYCVTHRTQRRINWKTSGILQRWGKVISLALKDRLSMICMRYNFNQTFKEHTMQNYFDMGLQINHLKSLN